VAKQAKISCPQISRYSRYSTAIPLETNPNVILTVLEWYPPSQPGKHPKGTGDAWHCSVARRFPRRFHDGYLQRLGGAGPDISKRCSVRWVKALGISRQEMQESIARCHRNLMKFAGAHGFMIDCDHRGIGSAYSAYIIFRQFVIPLLIRTWSNRTNDFQDCDIRPNLASSEDIPCHQFKHTPTLLPWCAALWCTVFVLCLSYDLAFTSGRVAASVNGRVVKHLGEGSYFGHSACKFDASIFHAWWFWNALNKVWLLFFSPLSG